jgi:hypothetical protein
VCLRAPSARSKRRAALCARFILTILDCGTQLQHTACTSCTSGAHCSRFACRALLKPEKFEKTPARAHPPPRLAAKYPGHAEAIELAAKERKIARGVPRTE